MYGLRNHAETTLGMIGGRFGHRIRCRSLNGRKNEVRVKLVLFDIVQLAMRKTSGHETFATRPEYVNLDISLALQYARTKFQGYRSEVPYTGHYAHHHIRSL